MKLYKASEKILEKIDAYLFLLKNLILFSDEVLSLGMEFTV